MRLTNTKDRITREDAQEAILDASGHGLYRLLDMLNDEIDMLTDRVKALEEERSEV